MSLIPPPKPCRPATTTRLASGVVAESCCRFHRCTGDSCASQAKLRPGSDGFTGEPVKPSAPTSGSRCDLRRRLDPADDLAEGDPATAGAGGGVAEHHLVAVVEEGPVGSPAELQQRPALVGLGAADGAGAVE